MAPITWLHLSDLHFNIDRLAAKNQKVVLDGLLADIHELTAKEGCQPGFIAVTGDIAFGGRSEEYRLAEAFFDNLLRETRLGKDRLFIVPGNHDICRSNVTEMAVAKAETLHNSDEVFRCLCDGAIRAELLLRLKDYLAWVQSYLGTRQCTAEHLFSLDTLTVGDQTLEILGFNTAWLAYGGDSDRARLVLGEWQVRDALGISQSKALRIALMHHPLEWLRDFDRTACTPLLMDGCSFILHGHLHELSLSSLRTPDAEAMVMAAGAAYASRRHPDSYNLVRLDFGASKGTVFFRTYSDHQGGFWTKDTGRYRNAPDGSYTFGLAKLVALHDTSAAAVKHVTQRTTEQTNLRKAHGDGGLCSSSVAENGEAITGGYPVLPVSVADAAVPVRIVQPEMPLASSPPSPILDLGWEPSAKAKTCILQPLRAGTAVRPVLLQVWNTGALLEQHFEVRFTLPMTFPGLAGLDTSTFPPPVFVPVVGGTENWKPAYIRSDNDIVGIMFTFLSNGKVTVLPHHGLTLGTLRIVATNDLVPGASWPVPYETIDSTGQARRGTLVVTVGNAPGEDNTPSLDLFWGPLPGSKMVVFQAVPQGEEIREATLMIVNSGTVHTGYRLELHVPDDLLDRWDGMQDHLFHPASGVLGEWSHCQMLDGGRNTRFTFTFSTHSGQWVSPGGRNMLGIVRVLLRSGMVPADCWEMPYSIVDDMGRQITGVLRLSVRPQGSHPKDHSR